MRPRTYFHVLINTFSSFRYYLTILNTKFSFSLRFLLISYILLGIGFSAVLYMREVPRLEQEVEASLHQLETTYPEHLRLEWDGNTFQSSNPTPLEIPYPNYFPHTEESPSTLAYLDTQVSKTEEISNRVPKSSLFFVTGKEVLISNGGAGWEHFPLKEAPGFEHPFVLTKEKLPEVMPTLRQNITYSFSLIKILLPSVVLPVFLMGRLIIILLDSVLIYYLIRFLARAPLPYWKIVQLSLHVLVVAETANLIVYWLLPHTDFDIFSIVFYVLLTSILLYLKNVRIIAPRSPSEEQE